MWWLWWFIVYWCWVDVELGMIVVAVVGYCGVVNVVVVVTAFVRVVILLMYECYSSVEVCVKVVVLLVGLC